MRRPSKHGVWSWFEVSTTNSSKVISKTKNTVSTEINNIEYLHNGKVYFNSKHTIGIGDLQNPWFRPHWKALRLIGKKLLAKT